MATCRRPRPLTSPRRSASSSRCPHRPTKFPKLASRQREAHNEHAKKSRPELFEEAPVEQKILVNEITPVSRADIATLIIANLGRIKKGASIILKKRGFNDPRDALNSADKLDKQSTHAKEAFIYSRAALKYFEEGDHFAALNLALIASDDFAKASRAREDEIAAASRKRHLDTFKRLGHVQAAGSQFADEHGGRSPSMGRPYDFEWINGRLKKQGLLPFKSYGAFRDVEIGA